MSQEINKVNFGDKLYPLSLREIKNPPKKLFVRGGADLSGFNIAIVGTRKATSLGILIAKDFSAKLSNLGVTIVSGLALGIDSAAHTGALLSNGRTIAVLGNGVDKIYPAQNESLAQKILETHGAIISEYEPGTPSYKDNFIMRNRIISGLSKAVIIIEAPKKSGAIATAGFAADQGVPVFVVPGPINHPNYVGSHALIRDGATLVTSPEEVLEDLGFEVQVKPLENPKLLNDSERLIFEIIKTSGSALAIDQIIELTKLEAQIVNQALAILIIQNIVKETDKGYTI